MFRIANPNLNTFVLPLSTKLCGVFDLTLIFGWVFLPRFFLSELATGVSLDIRKDMSIFAVPNNWFPNPPGGDTSSLDSLMIY